MQHMDKTRKLFFYKEEQEAKIESKKEDSFLNQENPADSRGGGDAVYLRRRAMNLDSPWKTEVVNRRGTYVFEAKECRPWAKEESTTPEKVSLLNKPSKEKPPKYKQMKNKPTKNRPMDPTQIGYRGEDESLSSGFTIEKKQRGEEKRESLLLPKDSGARAAQGRGAGAATTGMASSAVKSAESSKGKARLASNSSVHQSNRKSGGQGGHVIDSAVLPNGPYVSPEIESELERKNANRQATPGKKIIKRTVRKAGVGQVMYKDPNGTWCTRNVYDQYRRELVEVTDSEDEGDRSRNQSQIGVNPRAGAGRNVTNWHPAARKGSGDVVVDELPNDEAPENDADYVANAGGQRGGLVSIKTAKIVPNEEGITLSIEEEEIEKLSRSMQEKEIEELGQELEAKQAQIIENEQSSHEFENTIIELYAMCDMACLLTKNIVELVNMNAQEAIKKLKKVKNWELEAYNINEAVELVVSYAVKNLEEKVSAMNAERKLVFDWMGKVQKIDVDSYLKKCHQEMAICFGEVEYEGIYAATAPMKRLAKTMDFCLENFSENEAIKSMWLDREDAWALPIVYGLAPVICEISPYEKVENKSLGDGTYFFLGGESGIEFIETRDRVTFQGLKGKEYKWRPKMGDDIPEGVATGDIKRRQINGKYYARQLASDLNMIIFTCNEKMRRIGIELKKCREAVVETCKYLDAGNFEKGIAEGTTGAKKEENFAEVIRKNLVEKYEKKKEKEKEKAEKQAKEEAEKEAAAQGNLQTELNRRETGPETMMTEGLKSGRSEIFHLAKSRASSEFLQLKEEEESDEIPYRKKRTAVELMELESRKPKGTPSLKRGFRLDTPSLKSEESAVYSRGGEEAPVASQFSSRKFELSLEKQGTTMRKISEEKDSESEKQGSSRKLAFA